MRAYVARCSCGGMVMAVSAMHAKDAAKEVAKCVRRGYAIETMETEEVWSAKWCENRGRCIKGERIVK